MSEENIRQDTNVDLKSAPLKKLPDLKTLREQRGLTIEDIFLKTRVSSTTLDAIEDGEYHLLPAPVYAKRFIQSYAKTIGIDAESILVHYQRYLNSTQIVPKEAKAVKAQITFDRKPLARYLLYAVPAVAIIAAVIIVYTLFHLKEPTKTVRQAVNVDKQKEADINQVPAVKEGLPEAVTNLPQSTSPTVVLHKETTQTPVSNHLDLLIEATESTWLNITEDRNPSYQTTLKAGDKLNRKAQESFAIDVGNAAGVKITFLGKPLGNLGKRGQVVHLRLPQQ